MPGGWFTQITIQKEGETIVTISDQPFGVESLRQSMLIVIESEYVPANA